MRDYHQESLPFVPAKDVNKKTGTILCPKCQQQHGLFYKRSDHGKRTLHYLCNRVKRTWYENNGDHEAFKYVTSMGDVQFVDNLPVREEWTPKCRANFQKKHQGDWLNLKRL